MFSQWAWLFLVGMHIGILLIIFGNKRGEKGLATVQWGYLLFLAGGFGYLSTLTNFTIGMFCLVLVTGICWIIRTFILKTPSTKKHPIIRHFVHYSGDFFYILLTVFVLRAFLFEPFRIPSSSMRPGLVPGDFILVNKFTYGIRLPILNYVVLSFDSIKRGDVVVFNAPVDNRKVDFIKRIVGLPGDTITYKNKTLFINDKPTHKVLKGNYIYPTDDENTLHYNQQFTEQIDQKHFKTLNDQKMLPVYLEGVQKHRFAKNCYYDLSGESFTCKVPPNHYFMMGDNRDASNDSRYWGFVPGHAIVGKAFMIWLNFKMPNRIGTTIQ